MIVDDLRRHLRESAVWYGGLGLLTVRVARNLTLPPSYFWLVAREIDIIGVRSLTVALTAALFTGMVLALQSSATLDVFGARPYVGRLVSLSMVPSAARTHPIRSPGHISLLNDPSVRIGAVSEYAANGGGASPSNPSVASDSSSIIGAASSSDTRATARRAAGDVTAPVGF